MLFIIIINGCTSEPNEDMNKVCEDICLLDGFQYGKFVGMGYCNCFNRTIIINNTITINNTIPCNITCPKINTSYNRDYVLGLIRQLKRLEKNQDRYWNNTECFDDLNRTTNELDECKQELCNEWNSSWC